ncbi:MAG: N-6 DNA methylase [Blastocatellia bacterium]|nr:N-6 DNA methylase [Blastocatellia bacterium]
MQLRRRNLFTTIRTEGAILPADLLQRINDRDAQIKGLTPEDYHLAGSLKVNEAINQSYNRMLSAWASFQTALQNLTPTDAGTTVTREKWLLPLFQELSYGRLPTAKAIEVEGKPYPISHTWQNTPIHLVSAKVDLNTRTAGVAGAARVSPHGLVQELLNSSDAHLWGFVSNGLQLRMLRDNVSLTRQAYVEFDLEAMMNGELYADFALLWLLCHESRVNAEEPQAKPSDCWLEKWSKTAQEQGTRALDALRIGVEDAIKALGRGFISHPANQGLLSQLRGGTLDKQDYYRQLLRLVYRLLFLFVAEDRDLLFAPSADETMRGRYTRFYSVSRLRKLAERRIGTRHSDLYHGLRLVMQKLGNGGCNELGLPALGSFLFSNDAIAALNNCEIANHDLLEAIRALAFIRDEHGLRTVDYKNLRSEELGSVYEALLELHPIINAEARHFDLDSASGNERKTTGSYYTPDSLVQCLLDSALDPVVAEAMKQPDAEAALLRFKVVDPACGSGHFLIAAAHRLSKHLASVRTGDGEPAPEAIRTALRDVIGHCIYGVDINPMAVELCKVSLWMEALEPGKPLTFLEHRIQCGNALIGTTPALMKRGIPDEAFKPIEGDDKATCAEYKRYNKKYRESGQRNIFESEIKLGNLAVSLLALEEIDDSTIAGVREKQRRWEQLVRSNDYLYGGLLADAWCAAFVWKKIEDRNHPYPITEELFRKIEQSPWHVARSHHETEIRRLAKQYQFFHWHLAFPDVFRVPVNDEEPENELAGWNGGFDVVLGNPPWERIKLQEKEWFAERNPEIANAPNSAARRQKIKELREADSSLYDAFLEDCRKAEGEGHFVRSSDRYPLCGRGDINTYAIFAETNRMIVSNWGRVGCIVPSGIATDDTTKFFFQNLMELQLLISLFDFENRDGIFPGVHRSYKFCLLTLTGKDKPAKLGTKFVFFAYSIHDLNETSRQFTLSATEIALLNPNSHTCPIFRSISDAELTKSIYQRAPILLRESQTELGNPWAIEIGRMFHTSDDSPLFCAEGSSKMMRLYEAKCYWQFDHRYATFSENDYQEVCETQKQDTQFQINVRYYIEFVKIPQKFRQRLSKWHLSFRKITRSTDARTLIASITPLSGLLDSGNNIYIKSASHAACLLASLNSFVVDYVSRQKIGGPNMTVGVISQVPSLSPATYNQDFSLINETQTLRRWILSRVLELTYTAYDLQGFAEDCGYTGEPFRWDEARRFLLRAELDAAYFHLYGIARADVDYILDTFPIVKRKDEAQHGEYRTKRVILEIYDAMQQAITTGQPYQTLLDPPPANGWTPAESRDEGGGMRDEEQTVTAPQAEAFQLEMQDARPQPTLFDIVE